MYWFEHNEDDDFVCAISISQSIVTKNEMWIDTFCESSARIIISYNLDIICTFIYYYYTFLIANCWTNYNQIVFGLILAAATDCAILFVIVFVIFFLCLNSLFVGSIEDSINWFLCWFVWAGLMIKLFLCHQLNGERLISKCQWQCRVFIFIDQLFLSI